MTDEFGRNYTLDLSLLLNTNYVVMYDTPEQGQEIIDAAIEQYPDRVSESWRMNGISNVGRGIRTALSFRGFCGRLAWGNLEHYIEDPEVLLLTYEDLIQAGVTIPESNFGLEYIL